MLLVQVEGLQPEDYDFGVGTYAHRGPPGPRPVGSANLEGTDLAQSVDKLAVNSGGEPGMREKLPAVGVTGNLERDASFGGYGGAIWGVGNEDAGAGSVDFHPSEDGAHVFGVGGVAVGHAEKL